ncbi:MAG: CDP-glucose 4,6-dehydratase [Magnetovibrio sp.]|nr:CDP-glucose 4,6-dehydratase [Magnetovibrio sp.]
MSAAAELSVFDGRRVLVTGHTGFKGAWLALWLARLGARVHGLALPPEEGRPSLFEAADVVQVMDSSVMTDIREPDAVVAAVQAAAPEIVIHLAAQSLVRRSYDEPLATYGTNVMGTAHLLEAVRRTDGVRAVVVVTSDKCYENQGLSRGYHEGDPMGGYDPYSSSKGCAELVTDAYRRSFFGASSPALIASARSGNVIGGGDWAEDRLVPDMVRACLRGETATIRSPNSVRPWQHVLEPLRGYLFLAARLFAGDGAMSGPWNFGPADSEVVAVREFVSRFAACWDAVRTEERENPNAPHEAALLILDSEKARAGLGWSPVVGFENGLRLTADWYRRVEIDGEPAGDVTAEQIDAHMSALRQQATDPR